MRVVVQRVSEAEVQVDGQVVGAIGHGLVALVGVTHADTDQQSDQVARKLHGLRILPGEIGVADDPGAEILVISQFTLYGDVRKGRRPSWIAAAPGDRAQPLIDRVVHTLRTLGVRVETGVFGADMRVSLVNEGPMTLLIEV